MNTLIASDPVKGKLVSFLAAGVPPSAAASAAGVTPAYVTQLLDDEEFRTAVVEASAKSLEDAIAKDTKVEDIKAKALRVIEQKLPFVRSALEATRIYQILDSTKKQAPTGTQQNGQAGITMVNIILPKAAGMSLKLNGLNQVIEVEGRTMATLPSRELPILQATNKVAKDAEKAATLAALGQKDTDKAAEVLDRVTPLNTVIGGVVRVL